MLADNQTRIVDGINTVTQNSITDNFNEIDLQITAIRKKTLELDYKLLKLEDEQTLGVIVGNTIRKYIEQLRLYLRKLLRK